MRAAVAVSSQVGSHSRLRLLRRSGQPSPPKHDRQENIGFLKVATRAWAYCKIVVQRHMMLSASRIKACTGISDRCSMQRHLSLWVQALLEQHPDALCKTCNLLAQCRPLLAGTA
ncbi:TPA: hypothetical protein ACH3X2_013316 [Trebouxia sp. C0005]